MTAARPFLIATPRIGMERDVEPEWLPEDAYPSLEDAYMFRGRVQRRYGYDTLGRLSSGIVNESGGNATGTSFSYTLAHGFVSPGTVTVVVGALTFFDSGGFGDQTGLLNTNPVSANTGTINYITGAITLTFSPGIGATAVTISYNFYNTLPVMGLRTFELPAINSESLIAFDTIKANTYSNTGNTFEDISFYKTSGVALSWTGTNADFFYSTNYFNAIWTTNFVPGFQIIWNNNTALARDGIRWYDGTGWVNFLPKVDSTNFLMGALLIFSYRGRLVMLNTYEGTAIGTFTNYAQRARWSQNGTVFPNLDPAGNTTTVPAGYTGGKDDNAWRSDLIGKGGYIDAPTQEQIVAAQFYKDTLIVFFERSTWQLRYTGNETLPFIWERVNIDLGAESTFSLVSFDAGIIAIGNYGIVTCDATGVNRIDQIIPDEVFNIHNGNDGPERVYGIRDYSQQLVYWAFPSEDSNPTFPNRVLVYNYLDKSFSFFNDSFTAFGYYQPFNDLTWGGLNRLTWAEANFTWDSGIGQSGYPQVVAGNQQGFVFNNINAGSTINSWASLYLSAATNASPGVFTSPNHNFSTGIIIQFLEVQGLVSPDPTNPNTPEINNGIFRVSVTGTNTFNIQTLINSTWQNIDTTAYTSYTANSGLINIRNNMSIVTKRFNPFLEAAFQLRTSFVDLFMQSVTQNEMTLNIYSNENDSLPTESLPFDSISTSGNDRVWTRVYTSSVGQFIQMEITFSDEQIIDITKSNSDFTLHAMMPWFSPSGRLTFGNPQ